MLIYDIIEKKKNNKILSKEEIEFVVNNYIEENISDSQMASLLMAIVINGMNFDETFYLTKAMQNSGKTINFNFDVADKHSTGGVSDSTTLLVVPALACLGVKVAKMSGGSLGHTGGTKDKLSVFSGYNYEISEDEFKKIIKNIGASIIGQSSDIAIADKKIYDLRDKTCTVESIPLIASSIMSKKLALGTKYILLDVKYGSGAFMKNKKDAIKLARLMVKIGKMDNKEIVAIISNMNVPLSRGIGSSLEILSVIEALNGDDSNLLTLSKFITVVLYDMVSKCGLSRATKEVDELFKTNKVIEKLKNIVVAHGGSTKCFENKDLLLSAKNSITILSDFEGYIENIDAYKAANIVMQLKNVVESNRKNYQGIYFNKFINDYVKKGDVIATVYSDNSVDDIIKNFIHNCVIIGKTKKFKYNLIEKIIR